jgi:formylglycine-generating enzyme required for sulfatase activity
MKTQILICFLVLFVSFNVNSQKAKHFEPDPKGMKFVPQGSFQMVNPVSGNSTKLSLDAFWMSNEITNAEYREFVDYAKEHPQEELSWINLTAMAADKKEGKEVNAGNYTNSIKFSELSEKLVPSNLPTPDYFTDKKFDNYPVAGVTYRNAQYFCMWKTQKENKEFTSKGKPAVQEYRLPLEAEWAYAASQSSPGEMPKAKSVLPARSGKPNKLGLFNFSDNVSEWTATPGEGNERIIRGASWHDAPSVDTRKGMAENNSAPYLGFRIVRSFIGS